MKIKNTLALALLALGTTALLASAQDNSNDGPPGSDSKASERGGPGQHGGSYQRPGRSWKVTSGPDFFEKLLSNDRKSELFAKFWHLPADSRDETCIERKPGPDFSIKTSFRILVA